MSPVPMLRRHHIAAQVEDMLKDVGKGHGEKRSSDDLDLECQDDSFEVDEADYGLDDIVQGSSGDTAANPFVNMGALPANFADEVPSEVPNQSLMGMGMSEPPPPPEIIDALWVDPRSSMCERA